MVLMHRKICVGHRGFLDVDVINVKGVKRMAEIDKRLVYGKLHIYPASRSVYKNDQEVELTKMEFDVLYFLALNANIALTKEQIYEVVSTDDYSGGAYIIRDIIYRLRTKLEITNIQTLHGYGYKFSTDKGEDSPMS